MPTVFVTAPSEAADDIARTVVEERLAACVNRFPCRSTYRWDGEVHDDEEEILLIKTTEDGYRNVRNRIVDLHPHDVPVVERFDGVGVTPDVADWLRASVDDPE